VVPARWSNSSHCKKLDECSAADVLGTVISQNGDVQWPARSHDLCTYGYFLWEYLKSKGNINHSRTIAELKQNIRDETAAMPVEMTQQVMGNLCPRVQHCINNDGSHRSDIIFKK
jgi:hypothetical protein